MKNKSTHTQLQKNMLMVKNLTHLNNYAPQIRSFRRKAARFFFGKKKNVQNPITTAVFFAKMAPSHLVEDTLQPIADHILHLQAHGSQPTIFYMGVSKNRGTPKWMVYIIMENPIKMDDLGVPLFSERSIYMRWSILAITGTGHGPLAHPSEIFIGIPQPLPLG